MIVVNITVPGLENVYNMNIEEEVTVKEIIDEVSELISQKEHTELRGEISEMILGSKDLGIVLRKEKKLSDYGIRTGAELILV